MKLEQHDIELIEKSIDGILSEEERKEFDQKILNKDFKEAVEQQHSLLAGVEALEKVKLKEELKDLFAKEEANQTNGAISRPWYWIAASIVVLVGASIVYQLTLTTPNDLYNKYYEPYPAIGVVRGETPEDEKDEIMVLYSGGEYDKVISLINDQLESGNSFDGYEIFLGNAYMGLSDFQAAIGLFEAMSEDNQYYDDGLWFLSMCYLQEGKTEEALDNLRKVANLNTIYRSSALEIINQLQ